MLSNANMLMSPILSVNLSKALQLQGIKINTVDSRHGCEDETCHVLTYQGLWSTQWPSAIPCAHCIVVGHHSQCDATLPANAPAMRRCNCWHAYSFLLLAAVTCKQTATVDTQIASQESSCDSHEGSQNSYEGSRSSNEGSRNSEERSRGSDHAAVVTAAEITAIPAAAAAAATAADTTMDAIARSATRSFDRPHEDHNNNNNNKPSAGRLNDQIVRQTNDLNKAVAVLASAQKREHKMALLEREKCE
ncbi:Hypothetical protein CINCED_3A011014 [Cinara cedri]|uniref:Uncharacterized protein n=1 Tax=Cinara cedri TaxID=506608 RepID=A0A5E4MFZ4_9HEMI|nr:Hypothetical protein CINCED_3A011014 [Cinara cedri]